MGKARQKGKAVTAEVIHREVRQITVEEQVQEALQKRLPGVLAQLMPDLVLASSV